MTHQAGKQKAAADPQGRDEQVGGEQDGADSGAAQLHPEPDREGQQNRDSSSGAKGMPGQKERREADSSDSEDHSPRPPPEVMDLDPPDGQAAQGRGSPSNATDIFDKIGLGGKSKDTLPSVPERGEFAEGGGNAPKPSRKAPQAWPSPGADQAAIPSKIILVNANPGGQGKFSAAHQILSAIQVDARTCRIDVPDESMSIMESKFDPTHKVATSYLVSLPQEVKDLMLEEGEVWVPSEGYSEVLLGIFDATADGQIVIKVDEMSKTGDDLAAANGIRNSTAGGGTFSPRKKEQASVVVIYRMSNWQLGRSTPCIFKTARA
eukprot:4882200-Prymnesium_polylepis.1